MRATTKMLTNDPLCSTTLTTGKRMMCNDMWGLGLITVALLAGSLPAAPHHKHTHPRLRVLMVMQ